MVTPPIYNSDGDEDETMDSAFFAKITQDRFSKSVNEWCSCKMMITESERESVCYNDSLTLRRHRGALQCVTDGYMFKHMVLSEVGLRYSRYLYSLTIYDTVAREAYLKEDLTPKI